MDDVDNKEYRISALQFAVALAERNTTPTNPVLDKDILASAEQYYQFIIKGAK